MQVELPTDVSRELVERILMQQLRAKRDGTPFERMVFNLFTQNLRGWVASLASLADSHDRLHKMADIAKGAISEDSERVDMMMAIISMLVHKFGINDCVELIRVTDAKWYEDTNVKLRMEQDPDRLILTVSEEGEE